MENGEIIVYLIFIAIFSLNAFFLIKLYGRIRKLVQDQDTIISNQKKHLEFFDISIEVLKKMYVDREEKIKESAEFDKEQFRKDLQFELEKKDMKLVEKDAKISEKEILLEERERNVTISINYLVESMALIYRISYWTGAPPIIEKQIKAMKEGWIKKRCLEEYNRARIDHNNWLGESFKPDNVWMQLLNSFIMQDKAYLGNVQTWWPEAEKKKKGD